MAIGDFSAQSRAYARARPGYPEALLDRVVAAMSIPGGGDVADLGAGTGILTQRLVARGYRVTAVEPNAAMRALAEPDPRVRWRDGTFEATGLAGGSQDWAVAAQAFHWADPPRALPELRRVLRPGGVLSVMWNNRLAEEPVVAWTADTIRRIVPDFNPAYRNRPWGEIIAGDQFGDVHYDEERHVVPMSRERYLDLWRSHNRLTNIAGPERYARLMSEIEDHLEREDVQRVDVPYACRIWSARRR